jgi:hypothetical protein
MSGQINRGGLAGDFIYASAQNPDNKVFVEIGSWNGQGSTKCIMDALIDRFDDCVLYSLEANKPFYGLAVDYWGQRLRSYSTVIQNRLKLIHGRIIDVDEMIPLEELMKSDRAKELWPRFYENDLKSFETCENVFDVLPEQIDVLILDGGEFTTELEYRKLKDRSRIIICDDSSEYKCEKIRAELLEDSTFKVIIDEPAQRNGFCAFERIE